MTDPHRLLAYTPERAVEVCGGLITLNWLTEAMRRGEIEHVQIGRNRGITPQQLRKVLAAHTVQPKNARKAPDETKPAIPAVSVPSMTPRSRARRSRAS